MAGGTRVVLATALAVAVLGSAPAGVAAQRYAAPDSTDVTGACDQESAPCRLDHAIEGAVSDDTVILLPGRYEVDYRINPTVAVHVEGQDGESRPKLVGTHNVLDSAPAVLELLNGGSLRYVKVEATDLMQSALRLAGVTAEDLLVRSSGAEAVTLTAAGAPTVLRDSVVESNFTGMAAIGIDDGPTGAEDVHLRNVTAVANGVGAVGMESRVVQGHVTVLNSIFRGGFGANDVEGQDPKLDVGYSNFRPASSFGVTDTGGNQSGDPLFVNPDAFDYRTFEDSPTIDAGVDDALNGSVDPDGVSRNKGKAPNIGAYEEGREHSGEPKPANPPAGEHGKPPTPPPLMPPLELHPQLGENVIGGPAAGDVSFKPPGSSDFVPLEGPAEIPVGSVVDTRAGAVRLRSARNRRGGSQVGVFRGAMFRVLQRNGDGAYTVLKLVGGSFRGCRAGAAAQGATVVASGSRARRVRRLWGRSPRGRFRTRGRHGTATVRGTIWSTADRCDGTMVRVRRGRVLVRDLVRGGSRLLRRGQSYLARRR